MGKKLDFNPITGKLDLVNEVQATDVLTPAQLSAITWAEQKRQDELYEQALALFSITTTTTGQTYYRDVATSTTMVVTVTLKYDGNLVDADKKPDGWIHVSEGVYTKTVSGGAAVVVVAAQDFSFTITGGEYNGFTVTKSSEAKAASAKYPAYHGYSTSNTAADIENQIGRLTRIENNLSLTAASLANTTGSEAYYWILTHNSAAASQSGSSILATPISGMSFTSPMNPNIRMSGYKLYKSKNSVAIGGSLDNVNMSINV